MTPLMLPSPASNQRSRSSPVDLLRRQALERLYRRRETVDNLIRSLENYQEGRVSDHAVCVDINAARKCSSGFSQ
jgi:hypothetical protein